MERRRHHPKNGLFFSGLFDLDANDRQKKKLLKGIQADEKGDVYLEDFLTSGSAENETEYIRKREKLKFQKHSPSKSQIPRVTAGEIDQPPQTDEPIPTRHEGDHGVQQRITRIRRSMKGVNSAANKPILNSSRYSRLQMWFTGRRTISSSSVCMS